MVNYGDPRLRESDWRKIAPCPLTGCWLWTGARLASGYGSVGVIGSGAKSNLTHRYVYTELVGPIPPGLHIDHRCRVRNCVNPAHLEAVTQQENNRRAGAARSAATTHCRRGHEYTPATTIVRRRRGITVRWCRTCSNTRVREAREMRSMMGLTKLRKLGKRKLEELNRLLRSA